MSPVCNWVLKINFALEAAGAGVEVRDGVGTDRPDCIGIGVGVGLATTLPTLTFKVAQLEAAAQITTVETPLPDPVIINWLLLKLKATAVGLVLAKT